jgi:FixJ family two-component response regulator
MKSMGFGAEAFSSGDEFLASPNLGRTACLVTDVMMPGMSGLELYRRLAASGKTIPTIFITAFPDEGARSRAARAGVAGYLSKPFREDDLLACVRAALDKGEAR